MTLLLTALIFRQKACHICHEPGSRWPGRWVTLCFHVTEAVTLWLWRSLGVYSFPGHHHWLGGVACAFLLWLSMSSISLSPQNPDWALVDFLACVGASWLLGHHAKAPSDLEGFQHCPWRGSKAAQNVVSPNPCPPPPQHPRPGSPDAHGEMSI